MCIALVVPFYPFTNQIKEVGDPRTHGGDLGELRRYFVGGFIAGFGIGNTDVPIFVGGEWSRASGPPSGARGPAGSLPSISLLSRCLFVLPYTTIRKSARRWYDQIVLIAPNLVDATFYL